MLIGRIVYAGSKLFLSHIGDLSCLWETCGIFDKVDVDKHCYEPLDRLLARQEAIQKSLAKKHLTNTNKLVLYDITSSYLEGEYADSDLVDFGYNRDGKKGHEQIVIGLICNEGGCPVGVEVFKGNTKDVTTVSSKIHEIKKVYGINKAIFVGDRGMVSQKNLDTAKINGINVITALTRAKVNQLINDKIIQPSLFDETNIAEVLDTNNNWRYCLCKNPEQAKKNKNTRNVLIKKVEEKLIAIQNYKKATTVAQLGKRIGKVFSQYKIEKYFTWEIANATETTSKNHKIKWNKNSELINQESELDGCYVIASDVVKCDMSAKEIVSSYKKLIGVEQAFRNLKQVHLEIRPIYHRKDDRIRAHVFLCMLAYYVQWHMFKGLSKLTDEQHGKYRRYSFDNVIETLKQITRNTVSANNTSFIRVSEATAEQQRILDLLGIGI